MSLETRAATLRAAADLIASGSGAQVTMQGTRTPIDLSSDLAEWLRLEADMLQARGSNSPDGHTFQALRIARRMLGLPVVTGGHLEVSDRTVVTQWARLRGDDALLPGSMFGSPTVAAERPAHYGDADGMRTIRRAITYGTWADANTGDPVDVVCNACGKPVGGSPIPFLCDACRPVR